MRDSIYADLAVGRGRRSLDRNVKETARKRQAEDDLERARAKGKGKRGHKGKFLGRAQKAGRGDCRARGRIKKGTVSRTKLA